MTTVVGLCAAFLPTADVTSVALFETKMVVGVVGPTAIGWFLFKRAQRAEYVVSGFRPDLTAVRPEGGHYRAKT